MGMKYAIVFVDDYSRHTRVYFCKHKHEVPKLLRLYFVEMPDPHGWMGGTQLQLVLAMPA
jgi:hypothetical protein